MASIEEICSMQRERSFFKYYLEVASKEKRNFSISNGMANTREGESFKQGQKHQQLEKKKKKQGKIRTVILLKPSSRVEAT